MRDDKLIKRVAKYRQNKIKKAVVVTAIKGSVSHRKQMDIIKLFGTIDFVDDYDYKSARQ